MLDYVIIHYLVRLDRSHILTFKDIKMFRCSKKLVIGLYNSYVGIRPFSNSYSFYGGIRSFA